ncbi:serine hydrolase domain-containing protein [Chitinophaga barathri]|uniref:Class A beta-lactamase-related serine hydrolase n=1 Tax=Chitinophaga barathri TaxID=1647451 RepID=A0A3N4MXS9_9BACT|nr:serine hydrolase domain-containing protein [Chitinophaga barathri]RPD40213.1 class A beta-lactamase-related serine hydrolase [Chitinophaga barathri]
MKRFVLLFLAAFSGSVTYAQTWQDTLTRIEAAFAKYKPDGPGAQMAISRNGKVIFSKAWGMADLEHGIPMSTTSLIEAGSVSKQFTAAAILLLEQQGKLSLEDDVHKYVPELPDYGAPITLRQMMQHTSGLKDWGSMASLSGWPRGTKGYNNDDALAIMIRQKTLNNVPGAEYIYSNSNYNLLAIVVKRVSGKELSEFSGPAIFSPAGMPLTVWRSSYRLLVPGRTMAYSRAKDGFENDMPNESVYGQGGLLTTAEELIKWTEFYSGGKFGSPSLYPQQIKTNNFNNGRPHNYAAGLVVGPFNGQDAIVHSGATASYRANLEFFPKLGLVFAFLSNTSAFDRDSTAAQAVVRNIFVPEPPAAKKPAAAASFKVTEETLRTYTGWYKRSLDGQGVKLSAKDGKLLFGSTPLQATANNTFKTPGGANLLFSEGQIVVVTPNSDSLQYKSVEFSNINEGAAARYAGEYYSEEADSRVTVKVEGTAIWAIQKPDEKVQLTPLYRDGFDSPYGPVYFERDAQNKISGFKVSLGRARNVPFVKVK